MHRFRILSLDGGGIKGTFTAAVLAELERMTGKRLADYFDLITGTSTGGLIAIALGLGIPAEEVLDFYQREGPNIFPSMGIQRRVNILRWFCGPKYSATNLRNAIGCLVGNRRLGESKCRLAIPSFNAVNGDIYIFKTAHHERFKQDFTQPAIEVALATSAAPTYFPALQAESGLSYIDGGIWANCPVTIGIVEALAVLGRTTQDLEVLSIGTTDEPFYVEHKRRNGGLFAWNKNLIFLQRRLRSQAHLPRPRFCCETASCGLMPRRTRTASRWMTLRRSLNSRGWELPKQGIARMRSANGSSTRRPNRLYQVIESRSD